MKQDKRAAEVSMNAGGKRTKFQEDEVEKIPIPSCENSNSIREDEGSLGGLEYCKKITLKNLKVNMNDPISLLVQTCEGALNGRPEFEFE